MLKHLILSQEGEHVQRPLAAAGLAGNAMIVLCQTLLPRRVGDLPSAALIVLASLMVYALVLVPDAELAISRRWPDAKNPAFRAVALVIAGLPSQASTWVPLLGFIAGSCFQLVGVLCFLRFYWSNPCGEAPRSLREVWQPASPGDYIDMRHEGPSEDVAC